MKQTYLIAKYIENLRRNEPRNIGIILATEHGKACRFLPPSEAKFVEDKPNYKRWTAHWTGLAAGCMDIDTLQGCGYGHYTLHAAGEIMTTIAKNEVQRVIDDLYRELVAIDKSPDVV